MRTLNKGDQKFGADEKLTHLIESTAGEIAKEFAE